MEQQLAIPDQTTHVPHRRSPYSNVWAGQINFGHETLETHRWPVLSSAPQSTSHQSFISFSGFQPDCLGERAESRPITLSQRIVAQQFKQLLISLTTPPEDPLHHVVFSSTLRDRIQSTGAKRGRPTKHWLHETETKLLSLFSHLHPLAKQDFQHLKSFLRGTILSLGNSRPRQRARNIC